MFIYIRKWNETNKRFDVVTTHYGQIVVKEKGLDKENQTWHRISSPEDFLTAGIDYDEEEFKDEYWENPETARFGMEGEL